MGQVQLAGARSTVQRTYSGRQAVVLSCLLSCARARAQFSRSLSGGVFVVVRVAALTLLGGAGMRGVVSTASPLPPVVACSIQPLNCMDVKTSC